jgi:hypothetical protein
MAGGGQCRAHDVMSRIEFAGFCPTVRHRAEGWGLLGGQVSKCLMTGGGYMTSISDSSLPVGRSDVRHRACR